MQQRYIKDKPFNGENDKKNEADASKYVDNSSPSAFPGKKNPTGATDQLASENSGSNKIMNDIFGALNY